MLVVAQSGGSRRKGRYPPATLPLTRLEDGDGLLDVALSGGDRAVDQLARAYSPNRIRTCAGLVVYQAFIGSGNLLHRNRIAAGTHNLNVRRRTLEIACKHEHGAIVRRCIWEDLEVVPDLVELEVAVPRLTLILR